MDTKAPPTPQNAGETPVDDPEFQRSVAANHEVTDVSVKGLWIFAAALVLSIVVILIGLAILLKGYEYVDHRLDASRATKEPGARSFVRERPDYHGPLLQVTPEEDLRWMRTHNAVKLDGYGWVDREKGVVRVPVDRAIDLLATRGVPPVSPGLTLEAIQRQRADPQVYGQVLKP